MQAGRDDSGSPEHARAGQAPGARASWLRRAFRRIPWNIVGPLLGVGLFTAAIVVLFTILRDVDADKVMAAFAATPASTIGLSILFTALSYLALTGYDGLALRQIGAEKISYSTAAIGSFTSYAISYTLGLPLLTAGTVRYRVYGGAGLSGPQIAALTLVCTLTFWLGMGAMLGAGLLFVPSAVAAVNHLLVSLNMAIGAAIFAVIIAYVVYVSTKKRVVTVEGWSMPLPGGRVTVAQIALGAFDVCAGAAALYVLLPGDVPLPFFTFAIIYVFAAILGVASHAPGGIGVFEATLLIALPSIPRDQLLASVVLFRVIYYFIPFALALATLGVYELARRRHVLQRAVDQASGIMKPVTPILASGLAFIAGATMIISGAAPIGLRQAFLVFFVPLWIVELAQLAGAVAGVVLLYMSSGLMRRAQSAWYVASLMLGVSIVAVIMRGADYRLALVMFGGFAVLLLSRPAFTRNVRLYGQEFSWYLIAATLIVLGIAVWLGFFIFRRVEYHNWLWFKFGYDADMSRFLRSTAVAAVTSLGISLYSYMQYRAQRVAERPSKVDFDTLITLAHRARSRLAALPEFSILSDDAGQAAMLTTRSGPLFLALGDPVGVPDRAQDLVFTFTERAAATRQTPVITDATGEKLPGYIDAGFVVVPAGENLAVPLATLAAEPFPGAAQTLAWADRNGLSLDLMPGSALAGLMPELERVSDAWIAAGGKQGYFALGRFSPEWLSRNDCAILRRAGTIVGFAVVLRADPLEWSLDIIRYLPELGPQALDFIILRVMRLAAAQGVMRFDLGLTPTPKLIEDNLGPAWRRMTPLAFGLGDMIPDLAELRAFKLRYQPVVTPRYLVTTAGFALPHILDNISTLIENGPQEPRRPAGAAG